ncbi:hypothetical protein [Gimesia fumaroli]|uniref:Uncharacterized protein n=1 Tax=Gimesia fumaroli TaxID=2527976 RepID=A0A518I702_9PLAN|nr:hypothetical protein [Gimesia fumaroli]QDV48858.1 hypothetical protein Enr17x_08720 [Gimesia fumaroli]
MSKMNPWMLLVTAVFFSIAIYFSDGGGGLFAVGLLVLFNLVTLFLLQQQKENAELRSRLDALEGKATVETMPENRAVNPV